jgi:hypothetical protein
VDISNAPRSDYYEAVAAVRLCTPVAPRGCLPRVSDSLRVLSLLTKLHEQERGPDRVPATLGVTGSSTAGRGMVARRGVVDSGGVVAGDDLHHIGESTATSSVAALWSGGGSSETASLHGMHGHHGLTTTAGGGGSGALDVASFESGFDSGGQHLAPGLYSGMSGSGSVMGIGGPAPSSSSSSRGGGLHAPLLKRTGGGIQVGEHTGFLRMRGLPFAANKEEISKFFAGFNPIPESVVLTYRNDGRATGEAYIGFAYGQPIY